MARSWEDNAREFDALVKQGRDVRLALLVACSVEKGARGGDTTISRSRNAKVPAYVFGEKAGTSADRVLRHLSAWERLADRDLVPHAADLAPDDAQTLDVSDEAVAAFDEPGAYEGVKGGTDRLSGVVRNIEKHGPDKVVDELPPETFRQVVRAVSKRAEAGESVPARREAAKRPSAEPAFDGIAYLRGALSSFDDFVRWFNGHHEQVSADGLAMVTEMLDRIKGNTDVVEHILGGGINDEQLAEFLAGGTDV